MKENYSPNPIVLNTSDDIIKDPHRYGLPTFEEFCRSPDLWRTRPDNVFANADKGSTLLRRAIVKHSYVFRHWKTNSLEKMEKILSDYGLSPQEVEMKPELIPLGGGRCEAMIQFVEKAKS